MKCVSVKTGDKVKVHIEIECEVCTDLESVTTDQLAELIWRDEGLFVNGIKSIATGKIDDKTEDEHDTELLFENTTIMVVPNP